MTVRAMTAPGIPMTGEAAMTVAAIVMTGLRGSAMMSVPAAAMTAAMRGGITATGSRGGSMTVPPAGLTAAARMTGITRPAGSTGERGGTPIPPEGTGTMTVRQEGMTTGGRRATAMMAPTGARSAKGMRRRTAPKPYGYDSFMATKKRDSADAFWLKNTVYQKPEDDE